MKLEIVILIFLIFFSLEGAVFIFVYGKRAKKRELELEKFKLAVEHASDHIVITDTDGFVLYANKAAENMTGFSQEEIIGNRPSLWGKQMSKEYYQKMWQVIKEERQPLSSEITNKRKTGELYTAKLNISPVINSAGELKFFVGIERDVTKEKEIGKMKDELVYFVSHELKNPLSVVDICSEMLLNGMAGRATLKQKDFLNKIKAASVRMIALIGDFLNISKVESGDLFSSPALVSAGKIAEKAAQEFSTEIKRKKIKLSYNFKSDADKIFADPNLLEIIFQNLLSNAIKYTLENKAVEIGSRKAKKGTSIGGKNLKKDSFVIYVSDNGQGIPSGEKDKIFTKLFRATNAKGASGTGLGLYFVKIFVEKAGGEIWFESAESKGATFYAAFPDENKINNKNIKVFKKVKADIS